MHSSFLMDKSGLLSGTLVSHFPKYPQQEGSGTEILCDPGLNPVPFQLYDQWMLSCPTIGASEVGYWCRSLKSQEKAWSWIGSWMDNATAIMTEIAEGWKTVALIQQNDKGSWKMGGQSFTGNDLGRWEFFLCCLRFVPSNIRGWRMPALCTIDINGEMTYYSDKNALALI